MAKDDTLQAYYAQRAGEYEKIYQIPERQADIAVLLGILRHTLSGHDILEVACGTGYWTQLLAPQARSILATDINPEVIALAQRKTYGDGKVRFQLADALTLEGVEGSFTAGFAGFWWSHIDNAALRSFLESFHSKLTPGSLVVFADNNYVRESMHPIIRQDEHGNTYQLRRLENGSEFEVLKNFPTEEEFAQLLDGIGSNVEFTSLTYYWCLSYRIAGER